MDQVLYRRNYLGLGISDAFGDFRNHSGYSTAIGKSSRDNQRHFHDGAILHIVGNPMFIDKGSLKRLDLLAISTITLTLLYKS